MPIVARLAALLLPLLVAACSWTTWYGWLDSYTLHKLDGFLDLNEIQYAGAAERLALLHTRHRREVLPRYAQWMDDARAAVEHGLDDATAAQLHARLDGFLDELADLVAADAARVAATLTEDQIAHLEREMARQQRDQAKKYLLPTRGERLEQRAETLVEWIERFTGRLSRAQRERVAERNAQLPTLADAWLADRKRRSAELAALLRARPPGPELERRLRGWMRPGDEGRDPDFARGSRELRAGVRGLFVATVRELEPAQQQRLTARLGEIAAQMRELAVR